MTHMIKPVLAALIASTAFATAPAQAQVAGIATADTALAVIGTNAFRTGYQQIDTQFASQRASLEQRQQQRNQLAQQLDTNKDGQLDEAEAAAAPPATVTQVQQLDQEIAGMQGPVQRARAYVINQIALQYSAAAQQVISDQKIQFLLSPQALLYSPEGANVTPAITTALNARVPSAQITPPADWQPSQATVQLFQEIQQILVSAMQQQAQQAQQGQAQPPVEGR